MQEKSIEQSIYMTNSFSREMMKKIFEGCDDGVIEKNQRLYIPGQAVNNVYWLYEGLFDVYISNEAGEKQILAYHYPDSFVADIQSLSGEPSLVTCRALKKSRFKRCNVDIFIERIINMGLVRQYLKLLVAKAQVNTIQLGAISLDDCEARIKKYYNNELTHSQLAELVGCSRVQVTRILNKHNYDNQNKEKR